MKPLAPRAARPLAALVAALLALACALGAASPAAAHDGGGTFAVEQTHPTTSPDGASSIHYIVRLTWDNDGHAAEGATVTATAVDAAGTAQTPATLAPDPSGDGRYSGTVEFPEPGAWTVRFTSIEPTGTLDHAQEVAAAATTTTGGDDGSADGGGATDTTADAAGFAPADDGTGDSAAQAPSTAEEDDDGSGIPVLLIVGAAIVALGGVVTALVAIRRYRPATSTVGTPAGTDAADADAVREATGAPSTGTATTTPTTTSTTEGAGDVPGPGGTAAAGPDGGAAGDDAGPAPT